MLKNTIFVLCLLVIIFSSECTQLNKFTKIGGVTETGSGIKIESFEFNPTKIDNNMKTTASLVLKNTGDFDAKNIQIMFFGLSDAQWDILQSVGNEDVSLDEPVSFSTIRAQNKQEKIQLQTKQITLVLQNREELEEDIVYDYDIVARICYPYETIARFKIETISDDEFLILTEENKFRQYPITAEVSKGPLFVKITSKQPQVISGDGKVHLKMKITNIGGGTVAKTKSCENILNPTEKINELVANLNHIEFKGGQDCNLGHIKDDIIYLKKGKSKEIDVVCEVKSESKKEHNLKMTFNYDYYFDSKKIKVRVKGVSD